MPTDQRKMSVYCPKCHHRLFDKFSFDAGVVGGIEIKCPKCSEVLSFKIKFRLNIPPRQYCSSYRYHP